MTTSRQLLDALAVRYPEPEWLLWEEVSLDGVGRCDVIAINTYPSSGHVIHGFEVKVSRSDWFRELRTMRKSSAAYTYCHRWFLLSTPDVVMHGELPPTWGHLVGKPSTPMDSGIALRQVTRAAALEPTNTLSMTHLLRLSRRGRRVDLDEDQAAKVSAAFARGLKQGERNSAARWQVQADQRRLEAVKSFEQALGITISDYNWSEVAEAVRFVRSDLPSFQRNFRFTRERARVLLDATAWAGDDPRDEDFAGAELL